MNKVGIRKANNAGRLAAGTTGGNDLLHTLPVDPVSGIARTVIIRKIMAYNNSGADALLQFGTLDGVGAFVQLLPIFVAIDTLDNEWTEEEIPEVEFALNTTVGAAGRTGDIYVLEATGGGVDVVLEVEELGA